MKDFMRLFEFKPSSRLEGGGSPTAWFLGPKGENREALEKLISIAMESHVGARQEYMSNDPCFASEDELNSPQNKKTLEDLETHLNDMLDCLKGSLPLASYRNQSHMYWDITLPGIVGYFAAMLYNQNNVAVEASPVTTVLEIMVGKDLCAMLGFKNPTDMEMAEGVVEPWGHITCDGSIANGEAMWAARNLKYLPAALQAAICTEPDLAKACAVTVSTYLHGRSRLIDLSIWDLLNLPLDEAIGLVRRLQNDYGVDVDVLHRTIDKYSVQNVGLVEFKRLRLDNDQQATPIICVPKTAHYSWPKTAALIGLGTNAVRSVDVDFDGRMDMVDLRQKLDQCLKDGRPVLQVVAVVGSTEEGAVDPLADIVALREEYRQMGLEFTIHVDGAWGGYFASMTREMPLVDSEFYPPSPIDQRPDVQMSDYVARQYRALPHVESVTLDPHKSGFIPYPAGGLCYRNGAMRDLIAFKAPVVFHEEGTSGVGLYGIEGSKPGAAAASVYLSHAVIRTDPTGYGRLLGRCIFNHKRFYAALVSMAEPNDVFTITPFQRLPAEKAGGTEDEIAEQIGFLRREIVPLESDVLIEKLNDDKEVLEVFKAIGSDLSIVNYAFNFRCDNELNNNIFLMNEMNAEVFQELSIQEFECGKVPQIPMFVTSSSFDPIVYGQSFVNYFAQRTGVERVEGEPIKFLISTTQNPWLSTTTAGNFIPVLIEELRKTATSAAQKVIDRHHLGRATEKC